MKNIKMLLLALLAIVLTFGLALPASAEGASTMALNIASVMEQGQSAPMVAAGYYHTVGLKADGTVVAIGDNSYGQCDVDGWEDIIQLAAGSLYTVGLKTDGTVVAVGDNTYGQCNVGGWRDIVQVTAGEAHTVGIKADGTAVAVGDNHGRQCDVGDWTDICLLYTSPSPRDRTRSRMPSSA